MCSSKVPSIECAVTKGQCTSFINVRETYPQPRFPGNLTAQKLHHLVNATSKTSIEQVASADEAAEQVQ